MFVLMTGNLRLALVVGVFWGSHLLLAGGPVPALWGLDLLAYVPLWTQGGFLVGGVLLLVPGGRRLVVAGLERLPARLDPWRSGTRSWDVRLVVALMGLAAGVWLRSAVHLLGDGYLMVRELAMQIQRTGNEPLALWMAQALYRAGAAWGYDAESVYRLYSYAAGGLYLMLAFATAGALGRNRAQRTVVLGFLLTAGFVEVFCGYVETYPLLFPGTLLYLLGGVQCLRGKLGLWPVAGLLALLVAYHFISVTLVPSLGLLVLMRLFFRDGWKQTRRPTAAEAVKALAGLALAPALVLGLLAGLGVDALAYAGGLRDSHLLPLRGNLDYTQAYGLFAPAHFLDFLNQQLLVAPVVILVALGCWRPGRSAWSGEQVFILAAGLSPLAFTFVANPEIGAFRDWDVLAFPSLPLVVWAALVLMERMPDLRPLRETGVLVCGIAALHTLVWLGVNADPEAAVARFTRLLEGGYLSRHARSYGWETLGTHYRDQGVYEQALPAFSRAAEGNPDNPRHWAAMAQLSRDLGRLREAAEACRRALRLDEENPELWDLLGTVYGELGRHEDSVEAHRRALEIDGLSPTIWYNLGNAHARRGHWAQAAAAYQQAVQLQARRPEVLFNLGVAWERLGEPDRAEAAYRKVLELAPQYAMAHYRLARLYQRTGALAAGAAHAQRFLQEWRGDDQHAEEMRRLVHQAGEEYKAGR